MGVRDFRFSSSLRVSTSEIAVQRLQSVLVIKLLPLRSKLTLPYSALCCLTGDSEVEVLLRGVVLTIGALQEGLLYCWPHPGTASSPQSTALACPFAGAAWEPV